MELKQILGSKMIGKSDCSEVSSVEEKNFIDGRNSAICQFTNLDISLANVDEVADVIIDKGGFEPEYHSGNCTKECHPCMRCTCERIAKDLQEKFWIVKKERGDDERSE